MAKIKRTIKVENLTSEIQKIMKKYDEDLRQESINVMRRVCSAGAAAVRDNSAAIINNRYAQGWGYKVEEGRLQIVGYIYHKQTPGLPHLLEHGHAMPNGGRVAGRPHVAPVAETIERSFFDTTVRGIGNIV